MTENFEVIMALFFGLIFSVILQLTIPSLFGVDSGEKECHICVGDNIEYECDCETLYNDVPGSWLLKIFSSLVFTIFSLLIMIIIKLGGI